MEKRLPALDGVRGLAIILVVIWHYIISHVDSLTQSTAIKAFVYVHGLPTLSGVDLFFVLSGFLIGGIILDNSKAINFFRIFYLRRACRILPLYYGWLLFFGIVAYCFSNYHAGFYATVFNPKVSIWTHFLFLQNLTGNINEGRNTVGLAVTWSLAVEEQFYIIIPILAFFLSRRMLALVMVAVLIASPFIRENYEKIDLSMGNYTRLDGLAWGVLLALAFREPSVWRWMVSQRRWFLAAWWLIAASTWGYPLFNLPFRPPFGVYACFWALLLFLTVSQPGNYFEKILSTKPLVLSGNLAYGIYLFHYPVLYSVVGFGRNFLSYQTDYHWIMVAVVATGITWLISFIVFQRIEKPIIAWGHRFKYAHQDRKNSSVIFAN